MASYEELQVGQRVVVPNGVFEEADDYAPAGWLATPGTELIVRRIDAPTKHFPVQVSHEDVTDNSFGVKPEELEIKDQPK